LKKIIRATADRVGRYFREKITMANVLTFSARPPKQALKQWIGPIHAERERCLAVCLHPAAQGHWGNVARTFLCETAAGADEIIVRLEEIRAKVHAELKAELAAGLFHTGTAT
jgi:hypothetical protein